MQRVECDRCKQPFEIKRLKEKKMKGDVIHTFFKCPHCGAIFTVCYTNTKIRNLQRGLRESFGKEEDKEQVLSTQKRIKFLMAELRKQMEARK